MVDCLQPLSASLSFALLFMWGNLSVFFLALLLASKFKEPMLEHFKQGQTFLPISRLFSVFGCLSPSHDYWEFLRTQTTSHSVSSTFHRHKKKMHLCQITPALNATYPLEQSFCSFEFHNFTWFKKIDKHSFTERFTGPSLAATHTELAGNTEASGIQTSIEEAKPTAV